MTEQKKYDNNMTGVLFVADKEGNPQRPDRKGSCEIDGVKYWVSCWDKQTSRGETLSLKFEPAKKAAAALPSEPPQDDGFDDEILF